LHIKLNARRQRRDRRLNLRRRSGDGQGCGCSAPKAAVGQGRHGIERDQALRFSIHGAQQEFRRFRPTEEIQMMDAFCRACEIPAWSVAADPVRRDQRHAGGRLVDSPAAFGRDNEVVCPGKECIDADVEHLEQQLIVGREIRDQRGVGFGGRPRGILQLADHRPGAVHGGEPRDSARGPLRQPDDRLGDE
jgi:hypothetical protein